MKYILFALLGVMGISSCATFDCSSIYQKRYRLEQRYLKKKYSYKKYKRRTKFNVR